MKKFFFIVALLGCALVYLQQQSYAEKIAHKEYAAMEIKECNDCHKNEGIAPNHDTDFIRGHRVLAGKAGNNCNQCHLQKFCLDCHQGGGSGDDLAKENFGHDFKPKSHRSDFINIHPMKAQDNPQQCYRCHEAKSFCNSCHSRFPKGSLRIKSHLRSGETQSFIWSSEHASEARRNLQSCQACHADGAECTKCHSARSGAKISPHPRGFKTGNRNNNTCKVCH